MAKFAFHKLFFLFFIILSSFGLNGFANLDDLVSYSSLKKEYPIPDNDDWLHPDYTTFYFNQRSLRARLSSFFQRIVGPNLWSVYDAKKTIENFVSEREKQGIKGRFVYAIKPQRGTKVLIWGNLHGAFHSLVRDLVELNRHGILEKNLTIKQKNYFFVFNGSAIGRSPYSMEMLTLLINLMERNPQNIFYVKGNEEDNHNWIDFGLRTELKIRARGLAKEEIPLAKLMDRFFETLPLAFYLVPEVSEDGSSQVVRISQYGRDFAQLDKAESLIIDSVKSLEKQKPLLINIGNKNGILEKKNLSIAAIIKADSSFIPEYDSQGLQLRESDKGSTAWTVLSSPIMPHQKSYNFFYDAYAELVVAPRLDKWIIRLFYHDSRTKTEFLKTEDYFLINGQEVTSFKGKKIVRIGTTLDLSKQIKSVGEAIKRGLLLRINQFNKLVDAPLWIQLTVLDDGYKPENARRNIETLLKEYNTDIIIAPLGSPTLEAYIDLVEQKKIIVLFPSTGAPAFRKPNLTNMVHFIASYKDEARALTTYALKQMHAQKIVLFYQNDVFGKGALEGAQEVLKKYSVKTGIEIPYDKNATDFKIQAKKIVDEDPDLIAFFSIETAAKELIRQLTIPFLVTKKLVGLSDMGGKEFKNFINNNGLLFTVAQAIPNPDTSNLEIVKEFRDEAHKQNLTLSNSLLEGYIDATLLIEILINISGDITKEKIIEKIEQKFKKMNFKGLDLLFNHETRELSNMIWLDTGSKEWIIAQRENGY